MQAPNKGSTARSTASRPIVAFLLDYAPQTWCSREDYHVSVCQALACRGVQSVLVFAKDLPPELATRLYEKGIRTLSIDYGKGISHYHKELGAIIREYSITAVHICYFDYFSAIAWMARLHGVKTIIYEAVNSGTFTARSWKKFLLRLRTAVMTKPLKRVIAISAFVKAQLIAGGLAAEKIEVRHLGIDHTRFVPNTEAPRNLRERLAIDSDEVILTTVSFLNPFKNPGIIIRACGLVAREGIAFRLFVAGDGVLRKELEKLSRELGIADRVHWLGHVAEPCELLQGSDIFTLASTGEAFGLVLTEAMACGLPVVATRSGGIVEIVEDRVTGLLVPPLDPQALANALKELIQNPELRKTMGSLGQNRVAKMFAIDAVVNNTMRIYESNNFVAPAGDRRE